ncbi:MAG: hypothetical protein PHY85_05130 [Bacteroidales bacterium]|nr:hypothetical protein [Bacteroidales bacterium]
MTILKKILEKLQKSKIFYFSGVDRCLTAKNGGRVVGWTGGQVPDSSFGVSKVRCRKLLRDFIIK